ncbi:putative carbohydrate kinase PfkB, ribokinase, inositol 3-kinase [Helianthus debilis subsp. tardiflorus]
MHSENIFCFNTGYHTCSSYKTNFFQLCTLCLFTLATEFLLVHFWRLFKSTSTTTSLTNTTTLSLPNQPPHDLIIGNYCHDVLIKNNVVLAETLGSAAAFISAVLDGLPLPFTYVTKAGSDFAYTTTVNHPPITAGKTAVFHAYFDSDPAEIRREDRILKRIRSSDPILSADLPDDDARFGFGLAVGVAGEIVLETLEKMVELCDVVLVDRKRDWILKASAEEVPYVDVDEVRKSCCVVVTGGEEGCTVYWKDGEVRMPAFSSVQVDLTGAGDSFLGGLVAGLVEGLAVPDAAVLGNFLGSLTVEQIGLPDFDVRLRQVGFWLHCIGF